MGSTLGSSRSFRLAVALVLLAAAAASRAASSRASHEPSRHVVAATEPTPATSRFVGTKFTFSTPRPSDSSGWLDGAGAEGCPVPSYYGNESDAVVTATGLPSGWQLVPATGGEQAESLFVGWRLPYGDPGVGDVSTAAYVSMVAWLANSSGRRWVLQVPFVAGGCGELDETEPSPLGPAYPVKWNVGTPGTAARLGDAVGCGYVTLTGSTSSSLVAELVLTDAVPWSDGVWLGTSPLRTFSCSGGNVVGVRTSVVVPGVTGQTLADAGSVLIHAGCDVGPISYEHAQQEAGLVIGQSPAAGAQASTDCTVGLVVSKGPAGAGKAAASLSATLSALVPAERSAQTVFTYRVVQSSARVVTARLLRDGRPYGKLLPLPVRSRPVRAKLGRFTLFRPLPPGRYQLRLVAGSVAKTVAFTVR